MQKIKSERVGLSTERLNNVNLLINSYIAEEKLAGASTLVARYGQVAHFSCQGLMNLATKQSMAEDTIFRIYSMTKPITSVALMMLYEKGCFKLDTPVSKFIPEFKNLRVFTSGTVDKYTTVAAEREMVIADLLNHTSGLTYEFMHATVVDALYRQVGIRSLSSNITLEELISKLSSMPLLFSPGKHWNYSVATDVIAYLVQVISKQSFADFIRENILEPLAMSDTDFYVPAAKQDRFAVNYMPRKLIGTPLCDSFAPYLNFDFNVREEQQLIPVDDPRTGKFSSAPTFYSGGGGLVSTAFDYLKFAQMLLNKGEFHGKRFLNPETVAMMMRNYLSGDLSASSFVRGFSEVAYAGMGFGLGFAVMLDPSKNILLGSPGECSWGGVASTFFFVDPKEELIGILLTQLMPSSLYDIRREFKLAIYEAIIDG
jgi:CubicO group peptidase (beta-lactamase class C family)